MHPVNARNASVLLKVCYLLLKTSLAGVIVSHVYAVFEQRCSRYGGLHPPGPGAAIRAWELYLPRPYPHVKASLSLFFVTCCGCPPRGIFSRARRRTPLVHTHTRRTPFTNQSASPSARQGVHVLPAVRALLQIGAPRRDFHHE